MSHQQTVDAAAAERLKAQGNDLYSRGEHTAAKQKFTEAIEKNPKNAVLYANRAAVFMAENQYLDAAWDCRKAVELDPKYARAWGRLAAVCHSMSAWEECIHAWEKGLECLSSLVMPTPAQQAMKTNFELGLKKSKAARSKTTTSGIALPEAVVQSGRLPWDVAKAKYDQTVAQRPANGVKPSCIYLLHSAREDWNTAMAHLEELQVIKNAQGQDNLRGSLTVYQYLSNAVLADKRVAGMRDPASFEDKIRMQANLENGYRRGWIQSGGPAIIKKEAPERVKSEGWDSVRPALAVTIRIWIFTAWMRSQLVGHFDFAHEMLMNTLDVLEWGRNQWPDVSIEQRGTIFEKSFIRAVKSMLLEAMHESIFRNGPTKFTFEELIKFAEDLVEDVDSDPSSPEMFFGHRLAYWLYPKANALSTLGWAYYQQATQSSSDDPQRTPIFEKAAQYYLSAAKNYPEDEEYHVRFLVKALECLCNMGTVPLRQTLSLCDAIRIAYDQAIEIWGSPPFGRTLRGSFARMKDFEDKHRQLISEGRCTLDSVSGPLVAAQESG